MATSLRSSRITIDLQEYKQPWIEHCRKHRTTPSEAFRLIIAKLTANTASAAPASITDDAHDGKVRKEIRLTASEVAAAEALAAHEGYTLTRWMVALVRARLTCGAQLGQQELELLAQSNLHLLSMARSLQQVARVMAAAPEASHAQLAKGIEKLHGTIQRHTADVTKLIAANVRRWRA